MLFYVTLGTNDPAAAIRFYDPVLGAIGYIRHSSDGKGAGYGASGDSDCRLWVETPYDQKRATRGNGTMIALVAPSQQAVRDFHAAALANGGSDEGAPGLRPYGPAFFAAYVRDPDGNKLSAVHQGRP